MKIVRPAGRSAQCEAGPDWPPEDTGHWLWSWLPPLIGWGSACAFESPMCLLLLRSASLARKASGHVVLTKHSRVLFYHSLHLFMPEKLSTPLHLISDLGAIFPDQDLYFLNCGTLKPFLAIFAISKARCMLDCSSCTWPPCLALVADMLKSYKKLFTAYNNEIRRLPQPYTLL